MPDTTSWLGNSFCSSMRSGISTLQGPHHVAQKFTRTTLPLNESSFTSTPFTSLSVKCSGASIPTADSPESTPESGAAPGSAAGGGALGSILPSGMSVNNMSATSTAPMPSHAFCRWLSPPVLPGGGGGTSPGAPSSGSWVSRGSSCMARLHYHLHRAGVHDPEDVPPHEIAANTRHRGANTGLIRKISSVHPLLRAGLIYSGGRPDRTPAG